MKPHQELSELEGGGKAAQYIKSFNHYDIDVCLLTVFCSPEFDFVGGVSIYQLLKQKFSSGQLLSGAGLNLAKPDLVEKTGEEVHENLFKKGTMKMPAYWKAIIGYF